MPDDIKDTAQEIAIVGGGPAGLAAAEVLAQAGRAVTVYDRMPSVGRKLLIAGRGGLNLTHSEPRADFLARYHPAGHLDEAIAAFPPEALRDWCAELGEPTFVGSSGRVFPTSFKASPLLRAWLARLDRLGVRIRTRHRLTAIAEGFFQFETPDGAVKIRPKATLLALGGASWPRLGSDGRWVPLLEGLGVEVTPLEPANAGFTVAWSDLFRERFAGAPLKRVALACDGIAVRGEAVITEAGIEGGAVYALSRILRNAITARGSARLIVDLRPDLTRDALARRLSGARPGDSAATRLRKAAGLSPVAVGLLREVADALPAKPEALAGLIKAAPLDLVGSAPIERAISTAGGVRLDALDSRAMLRARPGLFLAGEMLDWEAPTGGYLLQGAFAGGRAAAAGMLDWLHETGG
ncbi:TIGR03862 family flavoprotein [Methylobacterium pseudosasicola]|nr:TIGR03862 family flavoprotein [Methylobacterium pseudosasicola]